MDAIKFDREFFSNPKKQQMRKVTITPDLADLWLRKRNRQNRGMGKNDASFYAEDMKQGNWSITNQGIGFDWDGNITDGQTRLEAIKIAGVSITMWVSTGEDPKNRLRVDCGRKRSTAHYLQMFSNLSEPSVAGKALWAIRCFGLHRKGRMTGEQTVDLAKTYRKALEWICKEHGGGAWGRAPVLGALAFAYEAAPDAVEKANQDLKSGAHLEHDDPILVYRNKFSQSGAHTTAEKSIAFDRLLAAIYHRINGTTCTQLKTSKEALYFFKNGGRETNKKTLRRMATSRNGVIPATLRHKNGITNGQQELV